MASMAPPLVLCSGCARHVKAADAACPFCGAARAASMDAPDDDAPLRLSRSALLLAGVAALAACNTATLAPSPAYGAPPPSIPRDNEGHVVAPIYGGPPPVFLPPSTPDASPASPVDAAAPVDASARPHRRHPAPPPNHAMPIPAYGVAPPPDRIR